MGEGEKKPTEILGYARFQILGPLGFFPRPFYIGHARTDNPAYHSKTQKPMPGYAFFFFSLEGEGCYKFQETRGPLPPGCGLLGEVGEPGLAYFYGENNRRPWRYFSFFFSGEAAIGLTRDLTARYGRLFRLPPDSPIVHRLLAASGRKSHRIELSASSGASLVMDLILALTASAEEVAWPARIGPAQALEKLLRAHVEKNLNMAEMAQRVDLSREHLTRAFRAFYGQAPIAYWRRLKLEHACRLLKETPLSFKEIARQIGYSQVSNFHRVFRQTVGMTAGEFRTREGSVVW